MTEARLLAHKTPDGMRLTEGAARLCCFFVANLAYLSMDREKKSRADLDLEERSLTNVICVDWRRQASDRVYLNSAYNTRSVGERVGEFILFLKDNDFIQSFKNVHIIGFSLGAQVAGYAGKFVRASRITKVGRITGTYLNF